MLMYSRNIILVIMNGWIELLMKLLMEIDLLLVFLCLILLKRKTHGKAT